MLERAYKSVPGVADDSGFGGTVMQYQVLLDPARVYGYHITVPQVMQSLSANNANAGGGFYSQGGQFYYVRGLGLVRDTKDIGEIVVTSVNGAPVRISDIGEVTMGYAPRLGRVRISEERRRGGRRHPDAPRRADSERAEGGGGEDRQLNEQILPKDVKVRPYYDRSDLVKLTIDTVENNLLRGMVLVLIVLIFFLVSFRAAIITALTIPLALLFSFIVLHAHDVSANLLSIGAIDFGIIIDGTVVMVENIYRELGLRHGTEYKLHEVIVEAARDVDRPIFYSVAVIIAGYLPIYVLHGPSGKLFHPMADTMSFALVGSLILALTLVPVMSFYFFRAGVKEKTNRAYEWFKREYAAELNWCLDRPYLTMVIATAIFAVTLLLVPFIGGEFMPHLDEGALWVRATMPYTISFEEASKITPQIRDILMSYPQVTVVGSELGRPDDGTDPTGFFNVEFYVGLKPYDDKTWAGPLRTKQKLTEALRDRLKAFPGIIFNFTQPAEDAVDEALTGLKSALAVKVYGADLSVLQDAALRIKETLGKIPGFEELTVVRELGQPSLLIDVNRAKIARYGINVSDVEDVIQTAVGGQAATQVIQGEKLFDLVVRMKPQFRESSQGIGDLLVGTPDGQQIPLKQLADIREGNGASFIYRENNSRYIGIQYSIVGPRPAAGGGGWAEGGASGGSPAQRLPPGVGWRVQRIPGRRVPVQSDWPDHGAAYLPYPLRAVRQHQVPGHRSAQRRVDRAGGCAAGAQADAHPVQRVVGSGTPSADGRVGGNGSHRHFLYQQAALAGGRDPPGHFRGLPGAAAADHDDRAGGLPGSSAGGPFHRHRFRLAEALCHRHCGGAGFAAVSGPGGEPGAV